MVFVISGNPAFSLDECPSSPEGGSIFVSLHSDWLSGLQWFGEGGGLHCSNGLKYFVILEINL